MKNFKKTLHSRKSLFIGLGFEITGMVLAGFFLGQSIGQFLGHQDLGAAIGCFAGFIIWLLHVLFLIYPRSHQNKK